METIISQLHNKFSEKTWNDTFQLVRRCMEKSRDKSLPCEPLQRSLQRLQEVFDRSSKSVLETRLEAIAKQHCLAFHCAGGSCYLTADLFYLEVALLPCGEVQVVRVAVHGGNPVVSGSFLQLLRSKDFVNFSNKLGDLSGQYKIPGDNKMKIKLFESLQALGKDLEQISSLQKTSQSLTSQIQLINHGAVGSVTSGPGGGPLLVQFYVSPRHFFKSLNSDGSFCPDPDAVVHTALLSVALTDRPHRLQLTSAIARPQLDAQGLLSFRPMSEVQCVQTSACFHLRLRPAVAMMPSLWNKLTQITDVSVPGVDQQRAPLPRLLTENCPGGASRHTDIVSTVSVAGGELHSYVFPTEAWETQTHRGVLVDTVPFTRLSHVPALLDVLRHQCVFNSVLSSALTSGTTSASRPSELHFEVLPENDMSFSVTFHPPQTDSLAVLVVEVSSSVRVKCRLFGAGQSDPSLEECVSDVIERFHSLPVALQSLYNRLSGSRHWTCPGPETEPHVTSVVPSHNAPVAASRPTLRPEINLVAVVDPYPSPPVFVSKRTNRQRRHKP